MSKMSTRRGIISVMYILDTKELVQRQLAERVEKL